MPAPPEPAKDLAAIIKAEHKAQKKRDRHFLNLLKLRIQPIMDQVKQKFKKFRTGVIDESQIRYLYDDEDPDIVTSDLPPNLRQDDHFRPFEKKVDKKGEHGLLEVASGRFFYNMEIVTIEKRLSNGYYKRPKDFLSDIKKLTKDAKAIGDQERLLKANELQANVEVDMTLIEAEQPGMVAELEAVYARETKREKDMIEKSSQIATLMGRGLELVPSNVPPQDPGASTEQSSGPIILGQPISNGITRHPITPFSNHSNPSQPSQRSIFTNGLSGGYTGRLSDLSDLQAHDNSNGTSVPSRENDIQMTNTSDEGPSTERETQNSSFGPSAQTRPLLSYTGAPASLQQRLSHHGSLSQRSAITPMAEGSNPQDYTNYASTTTSSGKRVSGSSGPFNTQSSQSRNEGPDLSMIPDPTAPNSQLPDTQGTSLHQGSFQAYDNLIGPLGSQISVHTSNPASSQSQPSQPLSQTPAVPAFPSRPSNPQAIHSLLNTDAPSKPPTTVSTLNTNPAYTDELLNILVYNTSGCSVEQLEQIYSALMDKIWKTRGNWNRVQVTKEVQIVFEDVMEDIKSCQKVEDGSLQIEE